MGLSLGVNRTWIKRDDRASILNVKILLTYIPKGQFWKKEKIQV